MQLEVATGTRAWIAERARRLPRDAALLAGLRPLGATWWRRSARAQDLERLARARTPLVVFLHGGDIDGLGSVEPLLVPPPRREPHALGFVIVHRAPPERGTRDDGPVRSFLCSTDFYRDVHRQAFADERSAFRVAKAVLGRCSGWVGLHALQWPLPPTATSRSLWGTPARADAAPVTWLIVHRGDPAWLDATLRHVRVGCGGRDVVWVCLDEPRSRSHDDLVAAHPNVHFWRGAPSGLGPYVARHLLGSAALTRLLVFQDSDDLPMRNRRRELVQALDRSGAGMVGSHELRVDDQREKVIAIRFPLDVSAALEQATQHPLMHPTSIVRVDAFRRSGGFSTARRFGADLQFLLRAHFSMRIRNVDAFLYLRWKRPGSLTTSPGSGLGEPERVALAQRWKDDFVGVRRGTLRLQACSLAAEHREDLHRVRLVYLGSGLRR